MRQHLAIIPSECYYKNKLPTKDKMNSSNDNNYVLKSYLNVFKWVADKMHGDKVSLGKVNSN